MVLARAGGEVMRAVVQRVTSASVVVADERVSSIDEPGLLVLVGVTHTDTSAEVDYIARKIADLRILREEKSVSDIDAPVLVVSQFTLYGRTSKGRRPTWNDAAPRPVAEPIVAQLVQALCARGVRVVEGLFGADMAVSLTNDGPVTLILDTDRASSQ